ncbi:hypothetical protein [Clostridium butyricum]
MIILETILGVFGAVALLSLYYNINTRLNLLEASDKELRAILESIRGGM